MQTTVSRVEEEVSEAPGNVYIFTKNLIAARGYRSLRELLQTIPGFTVFHRDLQYVAGVRGLNPNDNEKISLLLNGQNINGVMEPDYLNGPINLDNVERVEVVVGPSSLFQPANTLAATVNVITRDLRGVEVAVSAGNDLPYSGTVMAGGAWGEKSLGFSFTAERKDGFDAWTPSFRSNLPGRKITGKLDDSFFGLVTGRYGSWKAQAVAYRDQRPELLINNASRANDALYRDEIYSLFLSNEYDINDDWTSVLRAETSLKSQIRENHTGAAPTAAVALKAAQRVYAGEAGLRYKGLRGHMIQAGVQTSYDDNYDTWFTFAPEGFVKAPLVERDSYALGFYAHDSYEINDRLRLVGGLRLDRNTRLPDSWHYGGRAAVILHPTGNRELTSKFIFNRTVRFPSAVGALQTWGSDKKSTSPSWAEESVSARSPEVLSTIEFQQLAAVGPIHGSAAVYHQELKNFITWFQPWTNVGDFKGHGVELGLRGEISPNHSAWGNATYNDSRLFLFHQPKTAGVVETHHSYTAPDRTIIGAARWLANAGLDSRLFSRLTLSPAVRMFAGQSALDQGSLQYKKLSNVYFDLGMVWERLFSQDSELRLSIQNLFNDRDWVGSQMNGGRYRPRGIDARLTVVVRY